jgi:hypothetical protein
MAHLVSITSERHAQALRERDRFLRAHPQLLPLQRKIDARLGNAQTEHNRLVLIHGMMMDSAKSLSDSLKVMVRSLAKFNRRMRALQASFKRI